MGLNCLQGLQLPPHLHHGVAVGLVVEWTSNQILVFAVEDVQGLSCTHILSLVGFLKAHWHLRTLTMAMYIGLGCLVQIL